MAAKCPKCEASFTQVRGEKVTVNVPFGTSWNGISYSCPHCSTALTVEIDPIALKADIVSEVMKRLKK
jgi:hypothetical protein